MPSLPCLRASLRPPPEPEGERTGAMLDLKYRIPGAVNTKNGQHKASVLKVIEDSASMLGTARKAAAWPPRKPREAVRNEEL